MSLAIRAVGGFLFLALVVVLLQLRDEKGKLRIHELHHGYYGAVLLCLPWLAAQIVGLVLIADDLSQHARQLEAQTHGRVVEGDDSPVHRLYVGFARLIHWRNAP